MKEGFKLALLVKCDKNLKSTRNINNNSARGEEI